jgi:acyl carrier protein
MLKLMLEFFERKNPTLTAEALGELRVLSLLRDSLDVVDFMIFIEDKLGLETQFE